MKTNRYLTKNTNRAYTFGRHTVCPACGRRGKFQPYIDTATGLPVDEQECGRCERIYKCGYHLTPGVYFSQHPGRRRRGRLDAYKNGAINHSKPDTVPYRPDPEHVGSSLTRDMTRNPLYRYFTRLFGNEPKTRLAISIVLAFYRVGTSTMWGGSTIFWMLDSDGQAVDGKIMNFDDTTGRRIKHPYPQITWASAVMARRHRRRYTVGRRPMFGEHLVASLPGASLLLFESEKTALAVAIHIYLRHGLKGLYRLLPLAVGGVSALAGNNLSKIVSICKERAERSRPYAEVCLFPDQGCLDQWAKVANDLRRAVSPRRVAVSTLVEQLARLNPDTLQPGCDLEDVLANRNRIVPLPHGTPLWLD